MSIGYYSKIKLKVLIFQEIFFSFSNLDDLFDSKTDLTNFLLQLTPKLLATFSAIDVLDSS